MGRRYSWRMDPVASVAETARLVAIYRALESERPDALFRDPWARRLAGERGDALARRHASIPAWPMITRTRLIDDYVRGSIADGADRVVNLAAGLDMRAYRLDLPAELRWYEADLPEVVAAKESVIGDLDAQCHVVRRGIDLRDATLLEAFLDEALEGSLHAVVITEGFLVYLPEVAVRDIAQRLHCRPQVAWWVTDVASPKVRRRLERQTRRSMGDDARFQFGPSNGVGFFEPLGFRAASCASLLHEAARLKRLPFLLDLLARTVLPAADPAGERDWSGVARLLRVAGEP